MLRHGLAGFQKDLQRPEDAFFIGRVDARSRFRIDGAKPFYQNVNALLACNARQLLTPPRFGKGRKLPSGNQRIDIQSRAADNDDAFSACENVLHTGIRLVYITSNGKILRGVNAIDHMMLYAVHLRLCRLGGADVHAAVKLHGIAGNDFGIELLGKRDGQLCFSRGGRADDTENTVHAMPS